MSTLSSDCLSSAWFISLLDGFAGHVSGNPNIWRKMTISMCASYRIYLISLVQVVDQWILEFIDWHVNMYIPYQSNGYSDSGDRCLSVWLMVVHPHTICRYDVIHCKSNRFNMFDFSFTEKKKGYPIQPSMHVATAYSSYNSVHLDGWTSPFDINSPNFYSQQQELIFTGYYKYDFEQKANFLDVPCGLYHS